MEDVSIIHNEKWEYRLIEYDEYDSEKVIKDLNLLGKDGWENYHISQSLRTYFFKRIKS